MAEINALVIAEHDTPACARDAQHRHRREAARRGDHCLDPGSGPRVVCRRLPLQSSTVSPRPASRRAAFDRQRPACCSGSAARTP